MKKRCNNKVSNSILFVIFCYLTLYILSCYLLKGWSIEKQNAKRSIELSNGRAAQMGILALMVHEKLNNDPYIINSLLGYPVPFNH